MIKLNFFKRYKKREAETLQELFGYSLLIYISALVVEKILPNFLSYSFDVPNLFYLPFFLLIFLIGINYITKHSNLYIYKSKLNAPIFIAPIIFIASLVVTTLFMNEDYFLSFFYYIVIFAIFIWMLVTFLHNSGRVNKKLLFFSCSLLCFVFFFVSSWNYVVPNGVLELTVGNSKTGHTIIYNTGEDVIIGNNQNSYRLVTSSEVDFSLTVPRPFASANVEVVYSTSKPTDVDLAAQHASGNFSKHKLNSYNKILEDLPVYWNVVEKNSKNLFIERDLELFEKYNNSISKLQVFLDTRPELNDIQKSEIIEQYREKANSISTYLEYAKHLKETYNFELDEVVGLSQDLMNPNYAPRYNSIKDFLNNYTPNSLRTFNYRSSLDNYFLVPEDIYLSKVHELNTRGKMTLLLYKIDNNPLLVNFWYVDSNKHNGDDKIQLLLSQGAKSLAVESIETDDNTSDDGEINTFTNMEFSRSDLPPGLYRLKVDTSDDIFFTKVTSNAGFSYEGVYYSTESNYYNEIEKSNSKNLEIFTNSTELTISTSHEGSLQQIYINGQPHNINIIHKNFEITNLIGINKIEFNGDLRIRGDGVFSLNKQDPLLGYRNTSLNYLDKQSMLTDYHYIFADYKTSEVVNGWSVSSGKVTVPDISFQNNMAVFKIIFDKSFDEGNLIKIKSIKVTFQKEKITLKKIVEKISSLVK